MDYATMKKTTRKNIMDAVWLLYQKKAINKITVREITETANCSRGAFYAHFKDVYDVLEAIEIDLIKDLLFSNVSAFLNTMLSGEYKQLNQSEYAERFMENFDDEKTNKIRVLLVEKKDSGFETLFRDYVTEVYTPFIKNLPIDDIMGEYILQQIIENILTSWRFRESKAKMLPVGTLYKCSIRCLTENMIDLLYEEK